MDPRSLLTDPLYMFFYVVISIITGIYVWWHVTSSTSPISTIHSEASQSAEQYFIYQAVDGQAAGAKRVRKGRCLLSLDGGGIRTLSQIAILSEISNRIKHDLILDDVPRLCDYFDMIGGVGTGGLLAILIGRLGLTVQQAEKECLDLMGYISSKLPDTTGLDGMLKTIIKRYTGDSETLMRDNNSPINHCKVFVGVAAVVDLSRLVKLRSFESCQGQEPNLPIWKVARATFIHPGVLSTSQLGSEPTQVTYVSGELGWNNPSKEVIKEFEAEWKREGILCFTSIGAGHQGAIQLDASTMSDALNSTVEKMAVDCQRIAEEVAYCFRGQNNYFRLSVEHGLQLQPINSQNDLKLEDVVVHTKAYLDSNRTNALVNRLICSLLRADKVFPWQTTRERFEQAMAKYLHNTRSCVANIKLDALKLEALVAVSMLELIQKVDSYEEEWLKLAMAVDKYTTLVACDIIPKIWDPYLKDPLWPSTSSYLIELRKVQTGTAFLIEQRSDQIWETGVGESLPLKWAMDLKERYKGIQGAISSDMYDRIASLRRPNQGEERKELLSWLSSSQPELKHEDVKSKRSEGTGRWFLNASIFTTWCTFESGQSYHALLSFGAPGAGKTTLFSAVVEYLRQAGLQTNIATVFLYCDYGDQTSQAATKMIGSLASQLMLQAHSIPTAIWELYQKLVKERKPINIDNLRIIVNNIVRLFDCVYICIDALDECHSDSRRQLIQFLKALTGTTLRIFMTARPNVEAELSNLLVEKSISKLPIAANREDLQIYLSQKFAEDRYQEAMDEVLKAEITKKIVEWSQGIFLLSMLQISAVLEYDTKRSRKKALSKIPTELPETYTVTLQRLRQQPVARLERAILILTWIYHAERPLRVIELQCALAVEVGDTTFSKDGMPSETALVDCCLGLVMIERETSTIRFTHFTLQEYLNKHQDVLLPLGHTLIAKTCLTYLAFDHISDLETIDNSSPLIEYVGSNLGHHLRKGGDATTDERILDLLNERDKFTILEMFMGRLVPRTCSQKVVHKSSASHWIAFFGVHSVAKSAFRSADNLNTEENYMKRTPLSWAAANGHTDIVRLLITPRIELNPKDAHNRTPLALAAMKGHDAVVKLLINTPGVDLNPNDVNNRTPLTLAAIEDHNTVVKLLLDTPDVYVNPKDIFNQTPLSWAAYNGHDAIVKLLVNTSDVDLNPKNIHDDTPLSLSAYKGHDAIVKTLINTPGIDLNSADKFGRTALSLAALFGHDAVVQLLINTAGVDLNPKNANSQTPLALAASKGRNAVVKMLANTPGVDLNSKDQWALTPLSLAAVNGHYGIVQLLINIPGVELNSVD